MEPDLAQSRNRLSHSLANWSTGIGASSSASEDFPDLNFASTSNVYFFPASSRIRIRTSGSAPGESSSFSQGQKSYFAALTEETCSSSIRPSGYFANFRYGNSPSLTGRYRRTPKTHDVKRSSRFSCSLESLPLRNAGI